MNQFIMILLALGAVIGGLDLLLGNRLGLGQRFEAAFHLLGPTALSMAGIICLTPLLSAALSHTIAPLFRVLHLDPALLGGLLAMDMGGYQLSLSLACNPALGEYAGIIVAATLGCTISFTLPVGMGMIPETDRMLFARGILIGLCTMPPSLLLGGLLCGLPFQYLLVQSLPVFALSVLLGLGLRCAPDKMLRIFIAFAWLIRALSTLGLVLGAAQYMTGCALVPHLTPLEDAMAVVSSIGIVMLGSLPLAELLCRLLKKPFQLLGAKTGLNGSSMTGLLIGAVSVVPALALIRDMDARGKTVNAAFLVCAASTLAAHLGFAFSISPAAIAPLLAAKLGGGVLGAVLALLLTRPPRAKKEPLA